MDCAAYEPTGDLRKIARELIVGDCVEVYGAVHKATKSKPLTINLEKINILSLAPKTRVGKPALPKLRQTFEIDGEKPRVSL